MKNYIEKSVLDLELAAQYIHDKELVDLAERVCAKRKEVVRMQFAKLRVVQALIEAQRNGANDTRAAIVASLTESAIREETAFDDIVAINRIIFSGGNEDEDE